MAALSEDDLIARYFAPLALDAGADGLGDDVALLPGIDGRWLVNKDMLVGGVHFLPDDPAATIARKALRVNLSDLAAKGAVPAGFLLGLGLPDDWTEAWLAEFAAGLAEDARAYDCPLFGGDTVHTRGPLVLSVTMFGRVDGEAIPRRGGMHVGDDLWVSGTIGDAVLGLAVLTGGQGDSGIDLPASDRAMLIDRFRLPQPRLALAPVIRHFATASMDVSDGLAGDARKLLARSGLGADIRLEQIPLSPAAAMVCAAQPDRLDALVTGGDDYEVLFTAPAAERDEVAMLAAQCGVALARIGEVTSVGAPLRFLDADGAERRFERMSYSHF